MKRAHLAGRTFKIIQQVLGPLASNSRQPRVLLASQQHLGLNKHCRSTIFEAQHTTYATHLAPRQSHTGYKLRKAGSMQPASYTLQRHAARVACSRRASTPSVTTSTRILQGRSTPVLRPNFQRLCRKIEQCGVGCFAATCLKDGAS